MGRTRARRLARVLAPAIEHARHLAGDEAALEPAHPEVDVERPAARFGGARRSRRSRRARRAGRAPSGAAPGSRRSARAPSRRARRACSASRRSGACRCSRSRTSPRGSSRPASRDARRAPRPVARGDRAGSGRPPPSAPTAARARLRVRGRVRAPHRRPRCGSRAGARRRARTLRAGRRMRRASRRRRRRVRVRRRADRGRRARRRRGSGRRRAPGATPRSRAERASRRPRGDRKPPMRSANSARLPRRGTHRDARVAAMWTRLALYACILPPIGVALGWEPRPHAVAMIVIGLAASLLVGAWPRTRRALASWHARSRVLRIADARALESLRRSARRRGAARSSRRGSRTIRCSPRSTPERRPGSRRSARGCSPSTGRPASTNAATTTPIGARIRAPRSGSSRSATASRSAWSATRHNFLTLAGGRSVPAARASGRGREPRASRSMQPKEYLQILLDDGLALHPDLILVCLYTGNDFQPEASASPLDARNWRVVGFASRLARYVRGERVPRGRAAESPGAPSSGASTPAFTEDGLPAHHRKHTCRCCECAQERQGRARDARDARAGRRDRRTRAPRPGRDRRAAERGAGESVAARARARALAPRRVRSRSRAPRARDARPLRSAGDRGARPAAGVRCGRSRGADLRAAQQPLERARQRRRGAGTSPTRWSRRCASWRWRRPARVSRDRRPRVPPCRPATTAARPAASWCGFRPSASRPSSTRRRPCRRRSGSRRSKRRGP